MICPNCGGWNDKNSSFCRQCGARVQNPQASPPGRRQEEGVGNPLGTKKEAEESAATQNAARSKPPTHLLLAIVTTFFCCPVLGMFALLCSLLALFFRHRGEDWKAARLGHASFLLSVGGIFAGVLTVVFATIQVCRENRASKGKEASVLRQETLPEAEEEEALEPDFEIEEEDPWDDGL